MYKKIRTRNQNPFGAAPACLTALKKIDNEFLSSYLDGYYNSILIPKLSDLYDVPEKQIILRYGSDSLLEMFFAYAQKQKLTVLTQKYHYSYYDTLKKQYKVPMKTFNMIGGTSSFSFDIQDFKKMYLHHRPGIILLTSPNNPTGNALTFDELKEILTLSKNCLVVIDQAYLGFDTTYRDRQFLELLKKHKNLIFIRTFSKLYGLAALRIGFALCGKIFTNIPEHLPPYLGFNRISEELAVHALEAKNYYKTISDTIISERIYLEKEMNNLEGITVFTSQTNFIFIKTQRAVTEKLRSILAEQYTLSTKYLKNNFFRITIHLPKENKIFINNLKKNFNHK